MNEAKDIGELKGKVLIFGGVYSNLEALVELKRIAKREGIQSSNIICTGDIVGYCADPEECLRTIKEWDIHTIIGNVEQNIRNGEEDCGCNFDEGSRCDMFSRQWYPYAYKAVSDEMKLWLQTLPEHLRFRYADKEVMVLHGGLKDISQFIFASTDWKVKEEMINQGKVDMILSGHCGLPFSSTKNEKHWLNAGVIGMPANDGTTRVWYMILSDEKGFHFQHHSFEYNHQITSRSMEEKSLPKSYAKTLSTGLWDNCEILPEVETQQQGIPLEF